MDNFEDDFLENPEDISTPGNTAPKSKHEEQEEIFLRAVNGGGEWKCPGGKTLKLHPLSYARRRAAFAMGCRFGSLSNDEAEALQSDGYYKGLDTDVVIILWLCVQDPLTVMKALRLPEIAMGKALQFGEANQVEPGTPQFTAAAEFMMEEFVSLMKSQGKLVPVDKKSGKSPGKKPGKR